jgi:hypothetical protein
MNQIIAPTYAEIVDIAMNFPMPGLNEKKQEFDGVTFNYKPSIPQIEVGSGHEVFDSRELARYLAIYTHLSGGVWRSRAIRLVSAMLIHTCYAARTEAHNATLCDFHNILAFPVTATHKQLREYLRHLAEDFNHNPRGEFSWQNQAGEPTRTHPHVSFVLTEVLQQDDIALATTNTAAGLIALYGTKACGADTTIEKAA